MASPILSAPENQRANFVELFFDIVFVFAITQLAHQAAHHLDPLSLVRSIVVFWLVWWSWSQFTWALNAANTERHDVRIGTLIATGVAFVLAVSVDQAFGNRALWFAVSYVTLRMLGLGLYYGVASQSVEHRRGVRSFAQASVPGMVLTIVGAFLPPPIRLWVWLSVILFDIAAVVIAVRHSAWGLNAGHFAERHGLVVIIALGESLIVAATGVGINERTPRLMVTGALAVAATCLLWWTYFGWVQGAMEESLEAAPPDREKVLARDIYSLWHFPLICGVVSFAAGMQRIASDGIGVVSNQAAAALGIGILLFVGSTAGALRRAAGFWLWPRLVVIALTAIAVYLAAPTSPGVSFAIVCTGLALVITVEQVRRDAARATRTAGEEHNGYAVQRTNRN